MAQFYEEVRDDDRCVVRTVGDLDLAVADEFIHVVRASLSRCAVVELDLSEVTFIDSSGLSALVRLHKEADSMEVPLKLAKVSGAADRMLRLTGLVDYLDIRTSQT